MSINPGPNTLASDNIGLLAVIDPVSQGAATVTTGWIAAKDYNNFLATILVGAMTATGTVDAKLQQATSAAGAGAKDITGKAITQLTAASTDSNKQAQLNLKPEELDVTNSFTHFRLSITVAVAASLLSATVEGFGKRYGVASSGSVTTIDSTT